MKKILRELILPSFWLFFFAVGPKGEAKVNHLKKADTIVPIVTGMKKQELPVSEAPNIIDKNIEATFIKAMFLSGY